MEEPIARQLIAASPVTGQVTIVTMTELHVSPGRVIEILGNDLAVSQVNLRQLLSGFTARRLSCVLLLLCIALAVGP